ncbi:hypothetical protein KAFR_0A06750 [Kazachstania africana CBS 2517]|uniref:N(6)-L-threonylcarbamoyladenine synthase n=1 Tax=Kazachstania africana (strain ATCC 22294 / BCRC 22015 / CBS 2517 / CECT 1963 / NBRC 1671 / NRRL Y-8276) TaxID=1071382 RepID=H2AP10_KAZAF|nr:hypothetical protein KAFR_0A06750 [Kazachstania africana CBS 2517]CCF56110.1 hypothetical protein KAFR_0A06750 [Kazachstania africana CBS 2517]
MWKNRIISSNYRLNSIFCRRYYNILAIETSCDDTSIAYLQTENSMGRSKVVKHVKSTLDSVQTGGIIPTDAVSHHQEQLGKLLRTHFSRAQIQNTNVICVTRGPGMVGSLSVGLSFAKGLSAGIGCKLLGVHHMLGHLLVPRLSQEIEFPFISLLVSGGHSILVSSKSVLEHEILCESIDIAAGDALDKCGREIGLRGNMIGKELESFVGNPNQHQPIHYLSNPLTKHNNWKTQAFSFAPFITNVKNLMTDAKSEDLPFLKRVANEIQESIFEHIVTKIEHVIQLNPEKFSNKMNFVCSGGVSCNNRLRQMLQDRLASHFSAFYFPESMDLCTDNAVMIGHAGIEVIECFKREKNMMIENEMDILPIRNWPLTDLIGLSGWKSTCK